MHAVLGRCELLRRTKGAPRTGDTTAIWLDTEAPRPDLEVPVERSLELPLGMAEATSAMPSGLASTIAGAEGESWRRPLSRSDETAAPIPSVTSFADYLTA